MRPERNRVMRLHRTRPTREKLKGKRSRGSRAPKATQEPHRTATDWKRYSNDPQYRQQIEQERRRQQEKQPEAQPSPQQPPTVSRAHLSPDRADMVSQQTFANENIKAGQRRQDRSDRDTQEQPAADSGRGNPSPKRKRNRRIRPNPRGRRDGNSRSRKGTGGAFLEHPEYRRQVEAGR